MNSLHRTLTILLYLFPVALSWGKDGHEIVANIAYDLLTPETKEAAYNVLFPDNDFNATDHMSPLAAVATWADRVRFTHFFAWTTPLHYVDVKDSLIKGGCPVTLEEHSSNNNNGTAQPPMPRLNAKHCNFVYDRDCKEGNCAVGAIVDFSHLSRYRHDSLSARIPTWQQQKGLRGSMPSKQMHNVTQRQSLMFLIHIIGDIHQPLHVSRESDRGGNTIHVSFPENFGGFLDERFGHAHSGWNLHSVWDEAIIQRCMRLYHNSSQFLLQTSIEKELLTPSNIKKWRSCTSEKTIDKPRDCAEKWAKESFKDALMYAYKDEDGNEIVDGDVLTDAYFSSRLGIVRQRLAAAGVRLAAALEGVFQEQQSEMVQLK